MIKTFKQIYIDHLKYYYFVGGMPEVVSKFSENKDFNKVREIQNRILSAYEQDFSKHAPNEVVTRIRMLWNSIPAQLTKENKKFIYGLIKEGARANKAEINLQAKSLRSYRDKYKPELSIRTSMADYKKEDWLLNLPLYTIANIPKINLFSL